MHRPVTFRFGDAGAAPGCDGIWRESLDRVLTDVRQAPARRTEQAPGPMFQAAVNAAAAASDTLLRTFGTADAGNADALSAAGANASAELILAVAPLTARRTTCTDRRAQLGQQLAERLARHEESILAGELTYAIPTEAGKEATASLRAVLGSAGTGHPLSYDTAAALTERAIDVAALLLLATSNVAGAGNAHAPEPRAAVLDAAVHSVTAELATRAGKLDLRLHPCNDVTAYHLAAALDVQTAPGRLDAVSISRPTGERSASHLATAREAWLSLAAHEYAAVQALDQRLRRPAHDPAFGSIRIALHEGTINVVCGARLLSRPMCFDHRRAWEHQGTALTYALEEYVGGTRGDAHRVEQAQLVTLTRLTRATAAIVLLGCNSHSLEVPDRHANGDPV